MAFLDNSGDIILDAVLTDAGRQRMARGNFKITKFALGDEEVNYGLYNSSHPSGSAFYDLTIMQTPVLEAFTDNASMMKSRLVTMIRNNILFLPVLKLNNDAENKTQLHADKVYYLLADVKTQENINDANNAEHRGFTRGILRGHGNRNISADVTNHIAVDQGIDSTEGGITYKTIMPEDLVETAYIIRADHRLLRINVPATDFQTAPTELVNQFVDDDGIATYYVALGDRNGAIEQNPRPNFRSPFQDERNRGNQQVDRQSLFTDDIAGNDNAAINEVFAGPLGSVLRFYPRTSVHVQNSEVLFNEIGQSSTTNLQITGEDLDKLTTYKYIDTVINVVGVTTGYSLDIPIRIVRKV